MAAGSPAARERQDGRSLTVLDAPYGSGWPLPCGAKRLTLAVRARMLGADKETHFAFRSRRGYGPPLIIEPEKSRRRE